MKRVMFAVVAVLAGYLIGAVTALGWASWATLRDLDD